MILAAGFGTRLNPYSLIKPKPLFPLLNTPLLRATIKRLQAAGFERISVNCHHLGEQIVEELSAIGSVLVHEETSILGTGGGLRNGLDGFEDAPLLVTNGDIYHNVDLGALYRSHVEKGAEVTMALHHYPRFNTVSVTEQQVTQFHQEPAEGCLSYTGLQIINPEVIAEIKRDTFSCIIDHYRLLLQVNRTINAHILDRVFWSDMGTVNDYLKLHDALLTGSAPSWVELENRPINNQLVDPDAVFGNECRLEGWNCVGKAKIGDNVVMENCVVWDHAAVPSGSRLADAIIIPRSQ